MLTRGGRLDTVSIGMAGETLAIFHLQMNGFHAALMPGGARFDIIAYHPKRRDIPIRFQVRARGTPASQFGDHYFPKLTAAEGAPQEGF
jgi:hypothetical protein